MDLGNERARGVDGGQATRAGLLPHLRADAVGAINQAAPFGHFVDRRRRTQRRGGENSPRRDCCGRSRDRRRAADPKSSKRRSRVRIAITTPAQKPWGLANRTLMVRSLPCGDLARPRLPARELGPNPGRSTQRDYPGAACGLRLRRDHVHEIVGRLLVGETLLNVDEILFGFEKRIDDVRVEVHAALFEDHRFGDVVREGVLVDAFGGERVVDVGQGHDAAARAEFRRATRPCGYPLPSNHSWCVSAISWAMRRNSASGWSRPAAASVSAPMRTCDFMISNSLSVSGPPFSSTLS